MLDGYSPPRPKRTAACISLLGCIRPSAEGMTEVRYWAEKLVVLITSQEDQEQELLSVVAGEWTARRLLQPAFRPLLPELVLDQLLERLALIDDVPGAETLRRPYRVEPTDNSRLV